MRGSFVKLGSDHGDDACNHKPSSRGYVGYLPHRPSGPKQNMHMRTKLPRTIPLKPNRCVEERNA